jgi:hypothetical protein
MADGVGGLEAHLPADRARGEAMIPGLDIRSSWVLSGRACVRLIAKKQHPCKTCGEPGHRSATCGLTAEQRYIRRGAYVPTTERGLARFRERLRELEAARGR